MQTTAEGCLSCLLCLRRRCLILDDIFGCFTDTQRMIRSKDGWKYIRYPKADRKQLFNLAADPLELHDLSEDPAQAQRLGMLAEKLNAWRQEAGDPAPLP